MLFKLPKELLFKLYNFLPINSLGYVLSILPKKTYERSSQVRDFYQVYLFNLVLAFGISKNELNILEITISPLPIQYKFFLALIRNWKLEIDLINSFKKAKTIYEKTTRKKPELQNFKQIIDEEGLLVAASGFGHHGMVKQFLELNADPNSGMFIGCQFKTALFIAAEYGFSGIAKLLLESNAANTQGNLEVTPMMIAAEGGHDSIIKLLSEAKFDLNAKDRYGNTALTVAIQGGRTSTVSTLLELGAIFTESPKSSCLPEGNIEENKFAH